jgi:hypothetical protein
MSNKRQNKGWKQQANYTMDHDGFMECYYCVYANHYGKYSTWHCRHPLAKVFAYPRSRISSRGTCDNWNS